LNLVSGLPLLSASTIARSIWLFAGGEAALLVGAAMT
jgi:hypothetical protein